jgi:RNA recognition motif-containing protein
VLLCCQLTHMSQLPFHCQWQDLKDLFRQAGTILRADVAMGQDGRSRGFGMVSFATDQDADRAVKMFNG